MRPDGTEFIMKSVIKRYIKRNQSDGNGSKMKLQLKEFVTDKSANMMSVPRTVRIKAKKEICRQTNIVGVLPHENILMYF